MDKEKLENIAEAALLAAFFALIIYLGPAAAAQRSIMHDHPVGYAASDSFQHQARTEAIKQMGQYKNEAPYIVAGLTDVVGFYPPVLYHVTALISNLTGLETYDSLMLLLGIAMALAAMAAYHLTRSIGKNVALLALPMTVFMATGKPFLGAVTFGQMPFFLAALFLAGAGWAMTKSSLPRSYLLIGVFIAGTIMTHTSETIFLAIFTVIIFAAAAAAKLAKLKLSLDAAKEAVKENRELVMAVVAAAVITLYFLPMFYGIWMKALPYRFNVERISASFPAATVFPTDFGFMLILLLAGIIAAILLAIQKRSELGNLLHSQKLFPLAFSLYALIAGFGTYIGFGLRSFQLRLAWPILLAPLAAFGIYQIARIVLMPLLKNAPKNSSFIFYAILAVALSAAVMATHYEQPSSGSMGKDRWDAMKWVAENTPKDAKVYVLYSHVYSQTSTLYNTQRQTYFLELNSFIPAINQLAATGTLNRTMYVTIPSDSGPGFPYRTGLFSFDRHSSTTKTGGNVDICFADYYLIDKAFPEQPLTQANLYLMQQFAKANMTIEHDSPAAAILKNSNPGGDCIG